MGNGKYDRTIAIQRKAPPAGNTEDYKPGTWADHKADLPACFAPGKGGEASANEQHSAHAPAMFKFWYDPDFWPVKETDSIMDGGVRYHITSVLWNGRTNSEVEVMATRRALGSTL